MIGQETRDVERKVIAILRLRNSPVVSFRNLGKDDRVVAVKPHPELEPFFQLNYEEFVNKV